MLSTLAGGAAGSYRGALLNPLASPNTFCSDATNSYQGPSYQQFALFGNDVDGTKITKYLVGIEDNALNLANGPADSDYNDFLISITPSAVAAGNVGCSPGFWKNTRIRNWQLTPYLPTTLFVTAFGENAFPGKTLDQVLSTGGGGLNALGRQAVGALLNAAAIPDYELTTGQVISKFQAVYPGSTSSYETLKDQFEGLTDVNGRTCPLNNGNGR